MSKHETDCIRDQPFFKINDTFVQLLVFRLGCKDFNFIFLDRPSLSPELGDFIFTPPKGDILTLPLTLGLDLLFDVSGEQPSLAAPENNNKMRFNLY